MKPQPLDLEEIKEKAYDFWIKKQVKHLKEDSLNFKIEHLCEKCKQIQKDTIQFTINELKQRLKSACEFYLMFQDLDGMKELIIDVENGDIKLCEKEKKQLYEFHLEYSKILEKEKYNDLSDLEDRYNEWLFKLAFKGVFEDVGKV